MQSHMESSLNLVHMIGSKSVKRSILVTGPRDIGMSDQWRVSLSIVMPKNAMQTLREGDFMLFDQNSISTIELP